jgi:L-fucose isomerase-like protein
MDESAAREASAGLVNDDIDQLLILQVTFTDASMVVAAAEEFACPLSIWAVPEPRLGGRLRLNAFCGLNLASHALSLRERQFSWLYADPAGDVGDDLDSLLDGRRLTGHRNAERVGEAASLEGRHVAESLRGRRIARVGAHPYGFDSCAYTPDGLSALADISVDEIELDELFTAARSTTTADVAPIRQLANESVEGLADVDQDQLDRSLRLKAGLDQIRAEGDYDALAIRCWPETFKEYGGAACGPISMMVQSNVPCACEADVYGAVTQLLLQEAAGEAVFLTDLVDVDTADNTGVVWHCGQAPLSMRDPDAAPTATVHTNHAMPLLYQFALKPGPVTLLRISQSFNQPKMVLGFGEMLLRPMAFTGTSGVVRFDRPAAEVLDDIISSGLEHHMAIAYGDHREVLRSAAAAMQLPVLEI